ncbi:MAG: hypothetical protein GY696_15720 [Gammaproteobacteria bacterium]|nr:hypothetical protein [Gammaproteobacteria bacterium]
MPAVISGVLSSQFSEFAVSGFTSADGIFSCKEIQQLFARWSLSFGKDVAHVKARVLQPENLVAGDNTTFNYNPASGDWAKESRGTKLTKAVNLEHWVFVFPKGQKDKAEEFFTSIRDIGRRIGMTIEKPEMLVPFTSPPLVVTCYVLVSE